MIFIKTQAEILKVKESCRIVGKVLKAMKKKARTGITTNYLNQEAERIIEQEGGIPGFKGYKGYPYTLCASVNDIVLHGFPNDEELKSGDVLKIDVGVIKDGFYGDAATTIPIGKISYKDKLLLKCTKTALEKAIRVARPGNPLNYLSYVIQKHVESKGFNIVKSYGGHGIGRNLHEEPFIKNFTLNKNKGPILRPNMTIAIEPVVTAGEDLEVIHRDKWSICMKDGKNAAHFEHTVLITEGKAEILTKN